MKYPPKKDITKQLITQALKESRESMGILTLKEIAEILKEVLEPDEIEIVIEHLKIKEVAKKI